MILAVDTGIKNLSFCVMSADDNKCMSSYKIHLWDVYNTVDSHQLCSTVQKNGKICNKKCSFKVKNIDIVNIDNDDFYCKSHLPKDVKSSKYSPKKVNDYLLQDIAKNMIEKINTIYSENIELFNKLDTIILELQPSINSKMGFISHIIFGKLVELMIDTKCIIKFVRASQKLKAYTGPEIECKLKTPYAKRKWLSVRYTRWIIENKFSEEQKEIWLEDFNKCNNKLDDRSDTFLYCVNNLFGCITKRQKMNFKKNNIK